MALHPVADDAPPGASEYVHLAAPPGPSAPPVPASARGPVLLASVAAIALSVAVTSAWWLFFGEEVRVGQRMLIGSALTSALYVAVAGLVWWQLSGGRVRPSIAFGDDDTAAIVIGFGVGIGGGAFIVAVNSLIGGALTSDAEMIGVLYERRWVHVAVLLAITIIAAPLVEEILFRGLLLESFRGKGRGVAVLIASVAFSAWHVNPEQFRYYVLMGFLLGFLYWRFGLNGSITAHAVFNATLVVVAFAVVASPPRTITAELVSMEVPASWRVLDPPDDREDVLLVAEAPTGGALVLTSTVVPGGVGASMGGTRALASVLGRTGLEEVPVAGGVGLRAVGSDEHGRRVDTVAAARGERVYSIVFIHAGSDRAAAEFERFLQALRLPAG